MVHDLAVSTDAGKQAVADASIAGSTPYIQKHQLHPQHHQFQDFYIPLNKFSFHYNIF